MVYRMFQKKVRQQWLDRFNELETHESGEAAAKAQSRKNGIRHSIALFKKLLFKMNEAGVDLLVSGSDGIYVIPGYSMLEEMKIFASADIPNYDILKAATTNAANWLDQDQQWGSIEVGKKADFIVLDKNPLEKITNLHTIEGVCANGLWMDKITISKRLEFIENANN